MIGVVVGGLNGAGAAKRTDDIPQNINFIVKGAAVKYLLDVNGVDHQTSMADMPFDISEITARARRFKVVLEFLE